MITSEQYCIIENNSRLHLERMTTVVFQDLKPGDRARISSFSGLTPAYRSRLLSLGLTPGTEILVQHVAPLGDPVAILVRGFRLSLRRAEAAAIELEPLL